MEWNKLVYCYKAAAVVNPKYIQDSKLEDFVSSNTIRFFEGIGLSSTFLNKDPNEWFGDSTYIVAKNIVEHIKVVNDNAERGVSLITEYNRLHTCNEEKTVSTEQFLLQVVSSHRFRYPNCLKKLWLTKICIRYCISIIFYSVDCLKLGMYFIYCQ